MNTDNPRAEILSASAGSGKTYRLAYKYVRDVVENPAAYRNIIAVTFTNKATEEMKSRIIGQLHRLADNRKCDYLEQLCRDLATDEADVRRRAKRAQTLILHDYSRFTILTIDTFFQRVLRAFIRELGLELDYSLELDADTLLGKSAEILIKNIDSDPALARWLEDFCQEQLDNDRSWDVRRELLKIGREIFKEQNKESLGKASAKEELKRTVDAFVHRAEASRQEVGKLARQALEIMQNAGAEHSDFSRSCSKYFHEFAEEPEWEPNATVLKCAESDDNWFKKGKRAPAAEAVVSELRHLLVQILAIRAKSSRLWNTAAAIRKNFRSFALLADLYDATSEVCREERTMLLSETKYLLSQFITDSDTPFIYEKIGTRFDRFMIDEFQDTSLKEWRNFLPLLRNAMAQSDRPSVLLVGDIKQAIYRWRGGDRRILNKLAAEELGSGSTRTESLQDNYRSLPAIVDFNNRLIEEVVSADNEQLNARLDTAAAEGRISAAVAADLRDSLAKAYADFRQNPKHRAEHDGFVDVSLYSDEPPVIERIQALLDLGFKPKDIMILVRDKGNGIKIAEKLLEFKHANDNPKYRFDVMTQEALIIGSAPVAKFVTAALALALNPDDRIQQALFRRFGGAQEIDSPLTDEETAFLRSIRMLSPEEAFERIVMNFSLDKQPQHTAYLQALHERIARFCTGKVADIGMWLERWNETECNKSLSVEQGETTIEITTVHKAKGLEKKVVIIPYCNWKLDPKSVSDNYLWVTPQGDKQLQSIGNFPVSVSKGMADSLFAEGYYLETVDAHIDNINLLYVALTRPVESLHIFIPEPKQTKNPDIDNVGKLMLAALGRLGADFREDADGCRHMRFGIFAPPCTEHKTQSATRHITIENYNTRKADMRLALPSQRYFDEDPEAALSPRNFGILMHRAFAEAQSTDDIPKAVNRMVADALISHDEARKLTVMITQAMENPLIREWFDCGPHTEVRNENDIIMPAGASARRPDRVIIQGAKATVVDYKFGHEKRAAYTRQIAEYKSILQSMGYSEVKGFIWYVTIGEVEEV
ncbi:MAG: UvrD-helicase domain-containing protein [Alistipes sp.]|nr:UvrD-helicase domain-containing protein [Alistipes sp.]